MAFPPAHMLVAAGVAEVVRGALPLPRWRAWTVAALLAVSPDFDIVLGIFTGSAHAYHGTFTHSVMVTAVVGLLGWLAAGPRWGVLSAAGYGSHLVVDLLDDRGRTNVLLGWPFTEERPFAIAKVFPQVPFEQGNGVWSAFLSLFEPESMSRLTEQTLLGAAFFAGLYLLGAGIRRLRQSPRGAVR